MKKSQIGILVASSLLLLASCTSKGQTTGYNNVQSQEQVNAQKNGQSNRPSAIPSSSNAMKEQKMKDIGLSITTPKNGTTVTTPAVTIKGVTTPNAEVFVNDILLKANGKGEFTTPVTLDPGENDITVTANDEDGKAAEEELTVTLDEQ